MKIGEIEGLLDIYFHRNFDCTLSIFEALCAEKIPISEPVCSDCIHNRRSHIYVDRLH